MKRRRSFLLGLNGKHHREPETIPYNPVHKARCPYCRNLQTVYVPAIAEGHCNACGKSWRFLADPEADFERPTIKPRRIDYRDLVGFCIVMRRRKIRDLDEAVDRYRKLGIVEPDRDTFERAWLDAEQFA
jgi:ribosomal protein S27E